MKDSTADHGVPMETQEAWCDIVLFHDHYNVDHLQEVKAEMLVLGPPVIKAVWVSDIVYDEDGDEIDDGYWVALEGCHRLRAAFALRLRPLIDEVNREEHGDTMLYDLGLDNDTLTVNQAIVEIEYQGPTLNFADFSLTSGNQG